MASIVVNDHKVTAISYVDINSNLGSKVDFRILSLDLGYPTISVVHDLAMSSWKAGKYGSLLYYKHILFSIRPQISNKDQNKARSHIWNFVFTHEVKTLR